MILLIDLDGTLLSNSMESFQPHYFKALGNHLADYLPSDRMLPELLAGTRRMLLNEDPGVTLETAFDRRFYPALGFEKSALESSLLQYYEGDFRALGKHTHQIPEAIDFVISRLAVGDRIVVATNPLFPRVATLARLEWAGLSADSIDFDLITTYEFMHFSKPRPEYFAEILAYLGYPDEPVIMVGNDLNDDILSSGSLGIPGFWLTTSEPIQGASDAYHPSGTYRDLTELIDKGLTPCGVYTSDAISVLISLLKGSLAALHGYALLSTHQAGRIAGKLNELIMDRFRCEKISLETSPIRRKLTLNTGPSDHELEPTLAEYSRYRLAWLTEISASASLPVTLSENGLISLLQENVAEDRIILRECVQWLKDLPEIAHRTSR